MKRYLSILIGMALMVVPNFVLATGYYKSPIDYREDKYIEFGDSLHPSDVSFDMTINVDESSIASQWVNIEVTIDPNIIDERQIDRFLILANGKVIEEFYPQFYQYEDGTYGWRGYYVVKPSVPELIGTDVYFQVVAVCDGESQGEIFQYAVAWTGISQTIKMDDLPVFDEKSYQVLGNIYDELRQIYEKLSSLENHLAGLLNQIADNIASMFTPSQEAQQRLENASQQLWEKMPMKLMSDKTTEYNNMFESTKSNLDLPQSNLVFGEKRDWLGIGKEFYIIDLRGLESTVELIRNVLDAVIWIEFFMWLLFYLAPKLDI